jgi:hypothetical protein
MVGKDSKMIKSYPSIEIIRVLFWWMDFLKLGALLQIFANDWHISELRVNVPPMEMAVLASL